MNVFIREFFCLEGRQWPVEGYFSWQHLTFVSVLMVLMVAAAVFFGLGSRGKTFEAKNKVLIWAAILIDGFELFKIVEGCISARNPMQWVYMLPLFLCSIQLITIPLAAFSRGRIRQASLDFICVFGILGAVLGTYCAGNNYSSYPVLSFPNVVSGVTHCISGFASLYIFLSGMASMQKRDIPAVCGIMVGFALAAYVANIFTDCNYMFLTRGDGTPYDLLFNLLGGNAILYPVGVVVLFFAYIWGFYQIYYLCSGKKQHISNEQ